MIDLFSQNIQQKLFTWSNVRTYLLRSQFNELLQQVLEKDAILITDIAAGNPPKTTTGGLPSNYYNTNYCLSLNKCAAAGAIKKRASGPCLESTIEPTQMRILPRFYYERATTQIDILNPDGTIKDTLNSKLELDNQLSFASVIWLYYYERMGVFKILGALMDDYNYRGKLPISSKSENNTIDVTLQYSELMDTICTLYRLGIGSGLRDRIALYQRVLGVSIDNNLNVETEKNENFMRNFNKLIDHMLDFYKDKRLAQAIRDTSNNSFRSSVATQTAIRDTILVLQKNIETFEYGRNRINTYLGIATVYATISLLRMVKDEIGVPRQHNEPHEFIGSAYDILVLKKAVTTNETNRFTTYDNCASYGFRLLTDIELINVNLLNTISTGSPIDAWLNDIEGWVEGYRNAYSSVLERVNSIV
jgi:hypothetical protein